MTLLIVNCTSCGIEVKFPDIDLTSKKERDNVPSRMKSTLCEACTILAQKGSAWQGEIGTWEGFSFIQHPSDLEDEE